MLHWLAVGILSLFTVGLFGVLGYGLDQMGLVGASFVGFGGAVLWAILYLSEGE